MSSIRQGALINRVTAREFRTQPTRTDRAGFADPNAATDVKTSSHVCESAIVMEGVAENSVTPAKAGAQF
jgi:hypothetical protein